jgi:hypothetical protein
LGALQPARIETPVFTHVLAGPGSLGIVAFCWIFTEFAGLHGTIRCTGPSAAPTKRSNDAFDVALAQKQKSSSRAHRFRSSALSGHHAGIKRFSALANDRAQSRDEE